MWISRTLCWCEIGPCEPIAGELLQRSSQRARKIENPAFSAPRPELREALKSLQEMGFAEKNPEKPVNRGFKT